MTTGRSYYTENMAKFLAVDPDAVLGQLAQGESGDLAPQQRDAWLQQLAILKTSLSGEDSGQVAFRGWETRRR